MTFRDSSCAFYVSNASLAARGERLITNRQFNNIRGARWFIKRAEWRGRNTNVPASFNVTISSRRVSAIPLRGGPRIRNYKTANQRGTITKIRAQVGSTDGFGSSARPRVLSRITKRKAYVKWHERKRITRVLRLPPARCYACEILWTWNSAQWSSVEI
jgi:hypothetical protein